MKKLITVMLLLGIGGVYFYCTNNKTEIVNVSGNLMGIIIEKTETDELNSKVAPTTSNGVGTVTFVKDNNQFAAFGHSSINGFLEQEVEGNCYTIQIDEIKKATKNQVGRVNALINTSQEVGTLSYDSYYGVFGILEDITFGKLTQIETARRYEIKKGEAEIYASLGTNNVEKYKIEIEEINYFGINKNLKIKVIDEKLLERTGGIIQGMSGTPIIQNGKLVGGINYVNIDNPTEAYAIFVDKLL